MLPEKPDPRWLDAVLIRQVRESDLPALEWDGEYKHFRRLYGEAYERVKRGRSAMWVADLPGTGLIGQAFVQYTCDRPELADGRLRGYIYAFRVRPPYRGNGLGTRLLVTVEWDLRSHGYRYVTLNVAQDNPRARHLYEKNGYQVVAPEPGVWSYQDEKGFWHTMEEPAWRMEKMLY
jgi:ribosomal protein S18 acetylase RimI-like enzyme